MVSKLYNVHIIIKKGVDKMKRQVTLRLEDQMYKELRMFLLENDITFQKYVEKLITDDFNYYKGMEEEAEKYK